MIKEVVYKQARAARELDKFKGMQIYQKGLDDRYTRAAKECMDTKPFGKRVRLNESR